MDDRPKSVATAAPRFRINDASTLLSPSLVIDRAIVRRNVARMIAIARGADRLRPHVKTHKMAAMVALVEAMGIRKHKCATIAEAEMVARAGGTDVLLAYPVVGPNIGRISRLIRAFPSTTFRVLVDDADAAAALSRGLDGHDRPLSVLIDLEIGMGRTGIDPARAVALVETLGRLPNLEFGGLHAYDGQIHDADLEARRLAARPGVERTLALREQLLDRGWRVDRLVMGGTPTFPIHAELDVPGVECAPGTCALHDVGYEARYPDLEFEPAAALLTRVISRPRPDRLCLDLGHKAVAADPAGPRLTLPGIPDATIAGQSEEHLVVVTPAAADFPPGTAVLAWPTHICPTCALHRRATVVEDGEVVDEWEISARDRVLAF